MFFMRLAEEALSIKADSACNQSPIDITNTNLSVPSVHVDKHTTTLASSNLLHNLLTTQDVKAVENCSGLLSNYDNDEWPRRTNSLSLPRGQFIHGPFRPRRSTIMSSENLQRPSSVPQRNSPYTISKSGHRRSPQVHYTSASQAGGTISVSASTVTTATTHSSICSPDTPSASFSNTLAASSTTFSMSMDSGVDEPVDLTMSGKSSKEISTSSLLKSVLTGKQIEPDSVLFHPAYSGRSADISTPNVHKKPVVNLISCSKGVDIVTSNSTSQTHVESIAESMFAKLVVDSPTPTMSPPKNDSFSFVHFTYNDSPVQLAKKNLFPVQSRISEWLKHIAELVTRSNPSFLQLSDDVRTSFLSKVWHRLLLVCMMQANFSFTVTTVSEPMEYSDTTFLRAEPTVGFVQELKDIISDGHHLTLDDETYHLLKLYVITHFGPTYFRDTYDDVIRHLADHINCLNKYSQILLLLNKMYRFEPEVLRRLFCTHLPAQLSVEAAILSAMEANNT